MAKPIEALSIRLEFKDAGTQQVINKLSSSLKGMTNVVAGNTSPAISKLRNEILGVGKASTQSISNFRNQANALRALRDEARVGSATFKRLTEDIKKLDAQMAKAQSGGRRGISARATTQIAGAVVSGGIFGGPEGALGALGGAALGGVQGAFAGAAIGGQIGGIRQAGAAAAEYAANISKLRIALQGVTTSQREYFQGLEFVQQTTKDFAIPQEVVTRQFTKLQASVQGAGGNIDDTKIAFNGIVAAVRATGGSLADVDSALTATAQVFSKGKVSAEELRQQIGERLPGAFTLFAQSMGLTPQELDKALEKGQVSLKDFQGFAKAIFERYGENAKAIAAGPQSAGDRLKVQLEKLSESVGTLLRPIGAFFQETFGAIVRDITRATNALARFLNLSFDQAKLAAAQARFDAAQATLDDPAATARQRQRALQSREQARKTIATQARLRDAGIDVQQPGAGSGLAGVDDGTSAGTGTKSTLARRIEQAQKLEERTAAQLRLAQSQGQIGQLLARQANERASLESRLNKLIGDGTNEKINQAAVAAEANLEAKQEFELQKKIKALYEQAKAPLDAVVQRIKDKVNGDKMYKRLIAEGVNPELAKELVNIDKAFKAGVRKLDVQIENLKSTKAEAELHGKIVEGIDDQIAALERKKKALEGDKVEADKTARATIKEPTFAEGLDEAIEKQEDALKDLINPLHQVKEAANAIGEAFKTSFKGIITGSMTAREALRSFFQSIADHFADMAAQIAAEAIKLAALKFVGMIVKSFVGASAAPDAGDAMDGGGVLPMFANPGETMPYAQGGYVPGGFKAFSQGGIVSQPTLGMVGEGGEPEYIIPQSKMRESMSRYSRGVRGPSVIPSGGGATAASGGSTAVAAPIDVRYTVERINSVDYVTADQFQRGMQQAAAQGATQGEQRALTTLRQNTSQRRRIGL